MFSLLARSSCARNATFGATGVGVAVGLGVGDGVAVGVAVAVASGVGDATGRGVGVSFGGTVGRVSLPPHAIAAAINKPESTARIVERVLVMRLA